MAINKQKGFSLVEILAIVVVAGVVWWQYTKNAAANEEEAKALAAAQVAAQVQAANKAAEEAKAKSEAEEKAKILREADELNRLPKLKFPVAERASLSRVVKFTNDYYGKYLYFDLAGVGVDDLTSTAYYHYLNGVRDFETDEYVSHYQFEFVINGQMSKAFYEILPNADKGLIHFRLFCIPQYEEMFNKRKCRVFKIQQFNAGGNLIGNIESQIEEKFNSVTRAEQNEFMLKHLGKFYHELGS